MHLELIGRIRQRLAINPSSKSTLLRKQDLQQYALLLFEENHKITSILEPKNATVLQNTEKTISQKQITLLAYEAALKQQMQKKDTLENTIRYYRQFLEKSRQERRLQQQKIGRLRLCVGEQKGAVQLGQFEQIIQKDLQQGGLGQGQLAMLTLMKQFVELNKSSHHGY